MKQIENGNEFEAEADTLGELKMDNELVISSEDETGVVSEKEKGLVAEIDSIKDEDEIEFDIKMVADDEK